MEVKHSLSLPVGLDTVWSFLQDVPRVTRCIPGVEQVKEVQSHTRYQAHMVDRVGPFKVQFELAVEARFDEANHSIHLTVQGYDPKTNSRLQVVLQVTAVPVDERLTDLSISGNADVLGKLGTLGQPVVRRKMVAVMQQFGTEVQNLLTTNGGDVSNAS